MSALVGALVRPPPVEAELTLAKEHRAHERQQCRLLRAAENCPELTERSLGGRWHVAAASDWGPRQL